MPGVSCRGHHRRTGARKSWGVRHMQQQQPAQQPWASSPGPGFWLFGWSVGHPPCPSGSTEEQRAGSHRFLM